MTTRTLAEVEEFEAEIVERLGLRLEEADRSELATLLSDRMGASGCQSFFDYRSRLASSSSGPAEWRVLAERLTIGETYFFRNQNHFRAFVDVVLPDLKKSKRHERELRILSAACSSGEEPYTLAILLHDRMDDLSNWRVEIHAVDINRKHLARAAAGRYSERSVRQAPERFVDRLFHRRGRLFELDPEIRSMVSFEERNLLDDDPAFWSPASFDVVFCRNMIMYLLPHAARELVARLARSLRPSGYLFLGHAETMRGLSQEFQLVHSHETFYYRLRCGSKASEHGWIDMDVDAAAAGSTPDSPAGAETPPPVTEAQPAPAAREESEGDWYSTIRDATQRIASLRQEAGHTATGEAARPPERSGRAAPLELAAPKPGSNLTRARTALDEERFDDALALLEALPAAATDPEALLLRAVVLMNRCRVAEAMDALRRLLSVDDLNPGGHYQMGLCCEEEGNPQKAEEHYQSAAYLDPTFAMPHFRLARLAKREANLPAARRALRHTIELLRLEDTARVLFFGGGFGRDTLIRLCQAELKELGETP